MPRQPATYPPAYREQIIALARAGRTTKELAKEFEPSPDWTPQIRPLIDTAKPATTPAK